MAGERPNWFVLPDLERPEVPDPVAMAVLEEGALGQQGSDHFKELCEEWEYSRTVSQSPVQ